MNPTPLLLLAALHAAADTVRPPAPAPVVELSHAREHGAPGGGWSETALRVSLPAAGGGVHAQARHLQRFGRDDADLALGAAARLGGGWSGAAEGAASPAGGFLPSVAAGAELHRALGGGWVAGYGARGARHEAGTVWVQRAMVDRYLGLWLAGYTLTRADVPGGAVGHAHTLRGTRFHGAGSAVTAALTAGREAELTASGETRLLEVRSAALWGAQQVDPATALTFALAWTRYADAYERSGVRLGVRRRI